MTIELATDHRKICCWPAVAYDRVSPEVLARACLSDDLQIQNARLQQPFEMCGLVGDAYAVDGADVIKRLADAGPHSETEMRIRFQTIATEYMAARCASDAMRQGQSMDVLSMQMGNFSQLGTSINRRF